MDANGKKGRKADDATGCPRQLLRQVEARSSPIEPFISAHVDWQLSSSITARATASPGRHLKKAVTFVTD